MAGEWNQKEMLAYKQRTYLVGEQQSLLGQSRIRCRRCLLQDRFKSASLRARNVVYHAGEVVKWPERSIAERQSLCEQG